MKTLIMQREGNGRVQETNPNPPQMYRIFLFEQAFLSWEAVKPSKSSNITNITWV
jgi:hypothetical protein